MAKKILIIEDNSDLNELYKIAFERENFEVKTSFNGEEAIEHALDFQPDLMLLDVVMPIKNGFEVLQDVYQKLPKTLFVLNTGLVSEKCVNQVTKKFDRVKYLEKPIIISETVDSVMGFITNNKQLFSKIES